VPARAEQWPGDPAPPAQQRDGRWHRPRGRGHLPIPSGNRESLGLKYKVGFRNPCLPRKLHRPNIRSELFYLN